MLLLFCGNKDTNFLLETKKGIFILKFVIMNYCFDILVKL